MAWKVQSILNLEIPAGKAQPAPPLGPMLGAYGINIWQFIKEFNDKTMDMMRQFGWTNVKIKVQVTVFIDRSFKLNLGSPVTSNLILRKLDEKKWSGEPNKEKLKKKLNRQMLEEIAEIKKDDMNTNNLESVIRTIAGTAKNMGIEIEPKAVKLTN